MDELEKLRKHWEDDNFQRIMTWILIPQLLH